MAEESKKQIIKLYIKYKLNNLIYKKISNVINT